jgi:hypothetical protein
MLSEVLAECTSWTSNGRAGFGLWTLVPQFLRDSITVTESACADMSRCILVFGLLLAKPFPVTAHSPLRLPTRLMRLVRVMPIHNICGLLGLHIVLSLGNEVKERDLSPFRHSQHIVIEFWCCDNGTSPFVGKVAQEFPQVCSCPFQLSRHLYQTVAG